MEEAQELNKQPFNVHEGHLKQVNEFMEAAEVDDVRNEPLSFTAKRGHMAIAEVQAEREINVHVKRHRNDETALIGASRRGNIDRVRTLLKAGADVDAKDENEWNPLSLAAKFGYIDIVKILIEAGANVNLQNKDGETSLLLASRGGHVDIARTLIKAGAGIEVKDKDGWTPLNVAADNGNMDIVKMLIEKGANVNVQNTNGDSPLFLASDRGHVDIVKALIRAGADIDAVDQHGRDSLRIAEIRGYLGIRNILMDAGAKVRGDNSEKPLFLASRDGHVDTVRALIKDGADIHRKYEDGRTALSVAVVRDHIDIVETLIEAGANVNVLNESRESPLLLASKYGLVDVSRALLEAGVDIDTQDDLKWTPLNAAASQGYIDIVEMLIKAGADINAENHLKWPPLTASIFLHHEETAEVLTSHIAKLEAAGLYVSEINFKDKDLLIRHSHEWHHNYLQSSQNCKEEVEKLRRENILLYEFLKESDIDQLCSIWEKSESVSSKFNNEESLKHQYPEYAHILINKANQVRKEIFLHNHRPLIDVLSTHYKCDVKRLTFAGMKKFFDVHSVDFKEILKNAGIPMCNIVDFEVIKKRHILTLKVVAFEKVFSKWGTKEQF